VKDQRQAVPLFLHRQVGELSAAWLEPIGLWLLLYNAASPRGILARVAEQPWGPWSEPFVVFDPGGPTKPSPALLDLLARRPGGEDEVIGFERLECRKPAIRVSISRARIRLASRSPSRTSSRKSA
jgi:hypothetical protein